MKVGSRTKVIALFKKFCSSSCPERFAFGAGEGEDRSKTLERCFSFFFFLFLKTLLPYDISKTFDII